MKNELKIIVASKNPVKINAVKEGFQSFFPNIHVEGISTESGVADQPMSDKETLEGARNRAVNVKERIHDADFWVGIEGGVERDEKGLTAFAWIVVFDRNDYGEARTTTFRLPDQVTRLIDQGYELGTANDKIFREHNSKQNSGAVGLLTANKITRTQLYKQAVQLALIPFLNKELYDVSGD